MRPLSRFVVKRNQGSQKVRTGGNFKNQALKFLQGLVTGTRQRLSLNSLLMTVH